MPFTDKVHTWSFIFTTLVTVLMTLAFAQSSRPQLQRPDMIMGPNTFAQIMHVKKRHHDLQLTAEKAGLPVYRNTVKKEAVTVAPRYKSLEPKKPVIIFSAIADSKERDVLALKLDKRVQKIADNIGEAKLVIHLWNDCNQDGLGSGGDIVSDLLAVMQLKENRSARWDSETKKLARLRKQIFGKSNQQKSLNQKKLMKKERRSQRRKKKIETRRRRQKERRCKKLRRQSRGGQKRGRQKRGRGRQERRRRRQELGRGRQENSTVKIVVREIRPGRKAKRKVAVSTVRFEKATKRTTLSLNLSKKIVAKAVKSDNHTLILKLKCRRCRGHIHLDQVLTEDDAGNGETWLNPYRPYLYIKASKDVPDSNQTETISRSKRGVTQPSTSSTSWSEKVRKNKAHTSFDMSLVDNTMCHSERIWVTFKELGMDNFIIYPNGFFTDICVGTCLSTSHRSRFQRILSKAAASKVPFMLLSPPSSPSPSYSSSSSRSPFSTPSPSSLLASSSPPPILQSSSSSSSLAAAAASALSSSLYATSLPPTSNTSKSTTLQTSKGTPEEKRSTEHTSKIQDVDSSPNLQVHVNKFCAPMRHHPLTIWYIDQETGKIIPKEIPDLISESCGCVI